MFDSKNIISDRKIKFSRLGLGGVGTAIVHCRALLCTDGLYITSSLAPHAFISSDVRDNGETIYSAESLRKEAKRLNKNHSILWGK